MSGHDDYMFGTGRLKELFEGKIELAIISMAAQIKYCLENDRYSSDDDDTRLEIWKIIAGYVDDPKNKVKKTKKLKQLVLAFKNNQLASFLEENE